MGERDSIRNFVLSLSDNNDETLGTYESLGSVFRVLSTITWKINNQWDIYYEGKMILSDNTSRWAYYENQSQLHLGGIRYKFNINL